MCITHIYMCFVYVLWGSIEMIMWKFFFGVCVVFHHMSYVQKSKTLQENLEYICVFRKKSIWNISKQKCETIYGHWLVHGVVWGSPSKYP